MIRREPLIMHFEGTLSLKTIFWLECVYEKHLTKLSAQCTSEKKLCTHRIEFHLKPTPYSHPPPRSCTAFPDGSRTPLDPLSEYHSFQKVESWAQTENNYKPFSNVAKLLPAIWRQQYYHVTWAERGFM